ncbi:LytR C-terminal domain-containing protein [Gordonia caeni]|uniref:LytR/CpsA/Psr regulator C-terminal domain-containing protein n=1 Tax=Gordonia caeni TaxID=1007097 RepID=A0ABP7PP77_9ACTN
MKADREPNRLPLRAGAMLLLAVAVVFIALGWNSAASSGDESPRDRLAEAGQSAQATATDSPASETTASSPSSAPNSTSAQAGDSPKLCVLNAGTTTGLAQEVSDELKSAGFAIGTDPGNLTTSSVTENTIFYGEGEADAAEKVAEAVPGGASTEARPAAFSRCPGELAVVVVSR